MRRGLTVALPLALLLVVASGAEARGHRGHPGRLGNHGHFGLSLGWGVGWGPGWGAGWYGPGWWGGGWYGPWLAQPVVVGAPEVAAVDIDVKPDEALVYLDGQLIGTADDFDGYPDYLYLKPGSYTLEFRLQGYESQGARLDAVAFARYRFKDKLVRVAGEQTSPQAEPPEGLPVGRVFGPRQRQEATPPPAVPANPDTSLRPELQQRPAAPAPAGAALELRISPLKASVYVDGSFVGTGAELAALERGLAVTPGAHTVEVLAPGYEPRTATVEVGQAQRRQVVVELDEIAGQNQKMELH